MDIPTPQITVPDDYIPYPIRTQINQIDPRLDVFWQDYLIEIFKNLRDHDRKNVAVQLLAPKKIFWNNEKKAFVYHPDGSEDNLSSVLADIPPNARHLKAFAVSAVRHLDSLRAYEHIEEIADFLENVLDKIQNLDIENNLGQQVLKQRLYAAFIYAAGHIIRNKKNLLLPQNHRNLNPGMIITFINEVYLKYQLLGYWFKTLSNRQLAAMPEPLMHDFLCREQKTRQLQIVRTSKYLFAIAPTIEIGHNPFTIRRFLQEEALYSHERIIFNGVAINLAMLAENPPEYEQRFKQQTDYEARFRHQIEHIITLESNVNPEIFEFLYELEHYHEDTLLPMLFAPMPADVPLNKAVPSRLLQYEKLLTANVLVPFHHILRKVVSNNDEQEVIYIGIRQLFGNILSAFKDFLLLPALLLNEQADMLFGRLLAYTLFLEKRHDSVFRMHTPAEWDEQHEASQEALQFIEDLMAQKMERHSRLVSQINNQQTAVDSPGLLGRLLKRGERDENRLGNLKRQSQQTQWEVFQELLQLPKHFPDRVVHLEFDSLMLSKQAIRHYAFPAGNNGITRLPLVLAVPDSVTQFDLAAFDKDMQLKIRQGGGG